MRQALDALWFAWYEDPLCETGEGIYAMCRFVVEFDTLILGLEHSRIKPFGLFNLLQENTLDIERINALLDSGTTGALKTIRTAETAWIDVEPLRWSGTPQLFAVFSDDNYSNTACSIPAMISLRQTGKDTNRKLIASKTVTSRLRTAPVSALESIGSSSRTTELEQRF